MQRIPGWIVGALGTAALVGTFYAGGQVAASQAAPAMLGPEQAPVVGVASATRTIQARPAAYARPAVYTEPVEVYRPRSERVSDQSRDPVRRPTRSVAKSAVIIGSSAAVGATIGGLTKGRKGAVLGGLIGGGAATVWDQVTRRRSSNDR